MLDRCPMSECRSRTSESEQGLVLPDGLYTNPGMEGIMSSISTLPALPIQEGVEFRHVADFPGYCVGDDGSVWPCLSRNGIGQPKDVWRKLSPGNCRGYHLFGLHKNGRRYNRLAHRLVLEAFVGPKPPGTECCHNDGNRGNNVLANVRWDTRLANHRDQFRHDTRLLGERHPLASITDDEAYAVMEFLARGFSYVEVSDMAGISMHTVSRIARGKAWKTALSSGKRLRALKRLQADTAQKLLEQLVANSESMPGEAAEAARQALEAVSLLRQECSDWWDF